MFQDVTAKYRTYDKLPSLPVVFHSKKELCHFCTTSSVHTTSAVTAEKKVVSRLLAGCSEVVCFFTKEHYAGHVGTLDWTIITPPLPPPLPSPPSSAFPRHPQSPLPDNFNRTAHKHGIAFVGGAGVPPRGRQRGGAITEWGTPGRGWNSRTEWGG